MRCPPAVVGLAIVVLLANPAVFGQEAGAPPPEMKILHKLVGTWQDEVIGKVAEWTPVETREKTTSKAALVLGGRFVVSRIYDSEGEMSGFHVFTYDTARQAYRQWYYHSSGATVESTGKWDEASGTLTLTSESQGITGVFTIRFANEDTVLWTLVSKDQDGKVYLNMQGKSTRQK